MPVDNLRGVCSAKERQPPLFCRSHWRYPCTWVGIARLLLLASASAVFLAADSGLSRWSFVLLVGTVQLLDLFDGYLARKLGHVSRFGAVFDSLIDLTAHTLFWLVGAGAVAIPLMLLECGTGTAVLRAALRADEHWKGILLAQGGPLLRAYFACRQRNALSAVGVVSHFALPAALHLGWTSWALWMWVPGVALYAWVTLLMWLALRKARES